MTATESTRLLKANDLRSLGSKVAFNYEDLQRRCDGYIEQIRDQARQILLDAQSEADQMRSTAHGLGWDVGVREGREEALKEQQALIDESAARKSAAQLSTTLPALEAAARALDEERNRWLAEWQDAAIQLSVAIAEKILRRELQQRPELVRDSVLEALELAAASPQIQLRMHPIDVENLGEWINKVLASLSPAGSTEIVADPNVSAGGCVVQTQQGTIDAQLETKLSRIAEELMD